MAWGWGKKEEDPDEALRDTQSLSDMANVSLKIQSMLGRAKEKFGGQYDDVKLSVAVPALLQLIAQAQGQKSGEDVFQRDLMYRDAGDEPATAGQFLVSMLLRLAASAVINLFSCIDLEGMDKMVDFADWAYISSTKDLKEKLAGCGYSLLNHDSVLEAGCVGYYIAIDATTKTAVIGVKGTSSMTDMLTNCCAATIPHELENSFSADDPEVKEIRCHEGILISSKRLARDLEPFIRDLFIPLEYNITMCGHSLGAGAAGMTAILLRSTYPDLIKRDAIHVKAFASPPIVDHKTALACLSFSTTIVNNSDVITRASLANVEVLLKLLSGIQGKLVESGIDPVDYKSTAAFLSKLREGAGGDMLMTTEEGFETLNKAQADVAVDDPDHLYVPGRVLLIYGKWQDRVKLEEEVEKEKATEIEEAAKRDIPTYCVLSNGITAPLRVIEIDDDMVQDHLIASYKNRINGILKSGSS
eukprot:scaffold499_cov120-Cylindrotheca_fusiformis.AAC.6